MLRISGGSLRKSNGVIGGGTCCCFGFDFLVDIFDLRPLNDGALGGVVTLEADFVYCRILELRRSVVAVTSVEDPTCCWTLELCRVVSSLSAVTGAIV